MFENYLAEWRNQWSMRASMQNRPDFPALSHYNVALIESLEDVHMELYIKRLRKGWWRASEMAAYATPVLDFTANFKLHEWEGCRGPPDLGLS